MNILLFILSVVGMIYGAWFVAIAILGSLRKPCIVKRAAPRKRFAVVIPARNEGEVVGYLVRSLINQEYPRELYDVFVITNGCTDNTASAAEQAGACVVECECETHSKGDVLRFAFEKLPQLGYYDAYCILDADNLAAPGFLRAANDMLCAGWQIAQGFRDSKNPTDSWTAGDTSVFFWMMNRFYNRARSVLGMSAALNGTGIVMTRELVEKLGWNMRSLTEDLEFSGLCAANGIKIGYMEAGVVYDEQPVRIIDSIVQRRRWFSGSMQCLRIHFGKLIKKRSLHAADMLFIFGGCVTQVACLIPGIATVAEVLLKVVRGEMALTAALGMAAGLLAAAYVACAAFAYAVCRLEKKDIRRMAASILMFPIFLVTWFIANIWALVTPPPKWTKIAHVRGTDAPDK